MKSFPLKHFTIHCSVSMILIGYIKCLYSLNTGIKSEAMLLAAFKYVTMYNYMCTVNNDELFSETSIEPLDPPSGSKPGDRVYAEGYDKLGGT